MWKKLFLAVVLVVVIWQSRLGVNQWLLGWDSLVPELNWQVNFHRVLTGAWQEYQGVGLPGGMAHLADLPRMVILWVIDLVVPTNSVRWIWHVAMLILGSIGIWYMGRKLWKWNETAGLVASLFYLLNLATVQYFFVPYESFSSFYGFLPWIVGSYIAYLESGQWKDLVRLAVISLLATSAYYVQTLFVVMVMTLAALTLPYWRRWKRILGAGSTILAVNTFWILPMIYGVIQSGSLVGMAKINSIGSPETALMNAAYGGWRDVMPLRGYWLEWVEWSGESEWGRLMQSWWEWSRQVLVERVGWMLFGSSMVGLIWGMIQRKIRWGWLTGLLLAYIMVASFYPPFGFLYSWLVGKMPLFGEMFRSVFTKWSVVLTLFVSLGLGSLVARMNNKLMRGIFAVLLIEGMVLTVWPVFGTGIIFDKMKVVLPSVYMKLFEFMKTQPKDSKVAYLPVQDMWSWKYTDWGYRGSGFLWYGIEQPILDRAFDVWSPYNEGFYNEFSNAIYACPVRSGLAGSENDLQPARSDLGCKEQVARVLEKYDVRYVLLDESVIAPGQGKDILRIEETKRLAEELGWEKEFQEGFLTVWEVPQSHSDTVTQYVSAPGSYTWMEADTSKVREDVVYGEVGHYITAVTQPYSDIVSWGIYPFAGLMREEAKNVEWGEEGVTISASVPSDTVSQEFVVPGWEVGEIVRVDFTEDGVAIPAYTINGQSGPVFLGEEKPVDGKSYFFAKVSEGEEWREYRVGSRFKVQGESINIEARGEPFVYDFAKQGQGSIGNCDVLKRGVATKDGGTYTADSRGAVCDYIVMEAPFTRVPYLLRLRGENVEGRSIKFFLWNAGSKRNDIEYLLGKGKFDQTFALLPWDWDGYYTLNIETRSFGQRAENRMDPVVGMYVPLEKIARARIAPARSDLVGFDEDLQPTRSDLEITYVKKTGTWLYGLGVKGQGLVRLSQGYDEGWVAFVVPQSHSDKVTQLQHVKVDGWANGWIVGECTPISKCAPMSTNGEQGNQEAQIVIVFYWPQLLEYLGFALLAITLVYGISSKDEDK